MRFSKNLIGHIRRTIAIDKFLCYLLCVWAAFFVATTSFQLSNSYLSSPPNKGSEPRQYTECRDIASDDYMCNRSGTQAEVDSSADTKQSDTTKYIPKEFIKDKRDLNAQEGMWRATNLLGYWTIVQIFIGVTTIVLVGITIYQTRSILNEAKKTTRQARLATDAANRTAEVAERAEEPCVFFTVVAKHVEPGKGADSKIKAEMILKNYGKSPAINLNYSIRLIALDKDSINYSGKNLGPSGSGLILGAGEEAPLNPSLPEFSGGTYINDATSICHYMVLCSYGYDDVRGKKIRKEGPAYCEVEVWWPNEIPEDEAIKVTQINSETYVRYQNENDEYAAK